MRVGSQLLNQTHWNTALWTGVWCSILQAQTGWTWSCKWPSVWVLRPCWEKKKKKKCINTTMLKTILKMKTWTTTLAQLILQCFLVTPFLILLLSLVRSQTYWPVPPLLPSPIHGQVLNDWLPSILQSSKVSELPLWSPSPAIHLSQQAELSLKCFSFIVVKYIQHKIYYF